MQVGDRVRTDLVEGQEELEVALLGEDGGVLLRTDPNERVRALQPGVVTTATVAAPGIVVEVEGDDGNRYVYGHIGGLHVHINQRVTAGRTIGDSTEAVWFEVLDAEGNAVDVVPLLSQPGTPVEPEAVAAATPARTEPVDATRAAQEHAQEQGVDLSQIRGTGPGGRVTKADVQAWLEQQNQPAPL